jgi:hypothetical protein
VLGVDVEGRIHVIELKRDRTPREVVAQILDYGSWALGFATPARAALEDGLQLSSLRVQPFAAVPSLAG